MDRWKKQVEAEEVVAKNENHKLAAWRRKIGTSNTDLNAITVDEVDDQPEIPAGNVSDMVQIVQ